MQEDREDINNEKLITELTEDIVQDPQSFKRYADVKKYNTNDQLIADIRTKDYPVHIEDLSVLSKIYEVGFCLYTNKFTGDTKKYELIFVVHKTLGGAPSPQLQLLCFYQDYNDTDVADKELKNIQVAGSLVVEVQQLAKSPQFRRALSRN